MRCGWSTHWRLFALASFHAKHFMVLSQCFAHMQFNTYLISNGLHETIQREKICVIMRLLKTHFQMFLLICQLRDFWQCGDHSARACFAVRCLVSVCFSFVSLFLFFRPSGEDNFCRSGVFMGLGWRWGLSFWSRALGLFAKLWFYFAAEMPGMLFLDLSFRIQGI